MNFSAKFFTFCFLFLSGFSISVRGKTLPDRPLGVTHSPDRTQVTYRIFSERATRVELCLFDNAQGNSEERIRLDREEDSPFWSVTLPASEKIYYGYRAWGANWEYRDDWTPGSSLGFVSDVDERGNRFNPNKLLLDPYAKEHSSDHPIVWKKSASPFASGPQNRNIDSATFAAKGIVIADPPPLTAAKPERSLKDEIIYEVHLRGFTKNDPSLPPEMRGTYRGAAEKAKYLKELGITAVEFLPLHETPFLSNDGDDALKNPNYWGYMTLGYMAPDRRYAMDQSPGGPTREFRAMIDAFHTEGIKVYLDVVYNHSAEGGVERATPELAEILSLRGLDNANYYELTNDARFYWENTGCGNNLNMVREVVKRLIVDTSKYWRDLGVDGFRHDLASLLGNVIERNGFRFDPNEPSTPAQQLVHELPARPDAGGYGVDLIAEAWAVGDGTYQVGNFPRGWAEWNGPFRDTFRLQQNKHGIVPVPPAQLARYFAGSSHLFGSNRKPFYSINFLTAHDGFTLSDLYRHNQKLNHQAWPWGPSDGGEDNNNSWDQAGIESAQRQAARNGLALLMLSAGTPMLQGGDEFLRSLRGNNNAYNLDSIANWLDWSLLEKNKSFFDYARALIQFRKEHPALRRAEFFTGKVAKGALNPDITWHRNDGSIADATYFDDSQNSFLAYRIEGEGIAGETASSIYVAYNGSPHATHLQMPKARPGRSWRRVIDSAAWFEEKSNGADCEALTLEGAHYFMHPRSVLLLIEQ